MVSQKNIKKTGKNIEKYWFQKSEKRTMAIQKKNMSSYFKGCSSMDTQIIDY